MLHTLPKITTTKQKRLGRGFGSGVGGHTVGRGNKGHNARQGKTTPLWFEGGQLPLVRRFPFLRGKSRFNSLVKDHQEVQVEKLALLQGKDITPETLFAANLIKSQYARVKIIGKVEKLESVGEVRGVAVTNSARSVIEAAGGTITQE